MLHFYQSNQLETLALLFSHMAKEAPLDLMSPETVIVQSYGVGRWLNFYQAQYNGIAANIRYIMPASFAWELIRKSVPDAPTLSPYSPEVMTWKLFDILPGLQAQIYQPLFRYTQQNTKTTSVDFYQVDIFELAEKIADVFDQYLVFRPDWLQKWESSTLLQLGKDEIWQAALWQQLSIQTDVPHRASLLTYALDTLTTAQLPARITLFGISSLPPSYLRMIRQLAHLTDICLFTLNPCQEYWGDILDEHTQIHLYSGKTEYNLQGHPLLASLGKQGRDFFEAISADTTIQMHDLFVPSENQNILGKLQRDILTLAMPDGQYPSNTLAQDRSIAIHVAHSPVRELEILKDQLLEYFNTDPTLTPADVAVLTPNIQAYAPFIHAVFGYQGNNNDLPYHISDTHLSREYPLIVTLCALFDLLDSRFQSEDVLALTDCPALRRRFELNDEAIVLITYWIRQASIYWGTDKSQKTQLDLPAEEAFTWQTGLDRLLLGSIMPEKIQSDTLPTAINGCFPLSETMSGDSLQYLTQFTTLYDQIVDLARNWKIPADINTWQNRLNALLPTFFLPDESDSPAINLWLHTLNRLKETALLAGSHSSIIHFSVIKNWLKNRLTEASNAGFLNGGITFGAMVPMRNLPFRLLCLIGLNSGIYPREEKSVSFDLIAQHPQRGDRSRKEDDRYLFLESILSAREILYLSYVGRSNRSNTQLPPSSLISELLETLNAMCDQPHCTQHLVTEHPLQPFSKDYFRWPNHSSLFSYQAEYAQALTIAKHPPLPFIQQTDRFHKQDAPLVDEMINWDTFVYFWQLPAKAWLTSQLNITIAYSNRYLREEPFTLNTQSSHQLYRQLNEYPDHISDNTIYHYIKAQGLLPAGKLGDYYYQMQTDRFVQMPDEFKQSTFMLPFKLTFNGLTLRGTLREIRETGYYVYRTGKISSATQINAWLTHLVLCCLQPENIHARTVLLDNRQRMLFDPLSSEEAQSLLQPWLQQWIIGQSKPLPFFPKTSMAAAQSQLKQNDKQQIIVDALNEWAPRSTQYHFPESENATLKFVFRHTDPLKDTLFLTLSEILLTPLLLHTQTNKI